MQERSYQKKRIASIAGDAAVIAVCLAVFFAACWVLA